MAKFAVFLVAKILKMHIFLTFLNGYIHPNNIKNKKKTWGFAPNPTHLRGRRGRWQTLSTYPYGECWVDSKASRVKCTTSSPLTPLHLRGGSKTNRSGRSWKPVKACEATACGLAFTGWRRPNACGKGAGGFPLHPCHGERGCGQRPRCWQDPWGSRSRGQQP